MHHAIVTLDEVKQMSEQLPEGTGNHGYQDATYFLLHTKNNWLLSNSICNSLDMRENK